MRCLASLHSKQIQNSLAENKCALKLMSDGGFLTVSQYLWGAENPTIHALGSGRKLLVTAMRLPAMWKGWPSARSPHLWHQIYFP